MIKAFVLAASVVLSGVVMACYDKPLSAYEKCVITFAGSVVGDSGETRSIHHLKYTACKTLKEKK